MSATLVPLASHCHYLRGWLYWTSVFADEDDNLVVLTHRCESSYGLRGRDTRWGQVAYGFDGEGNAVKAVANVGVFPTVYGLSDGVTCKIARRPAEVPEGARALLRHAEQVLIGGGAEIDVADALRPDGKFKGAQCAWPPERSNFDGGLEVVA